MFVLKVKVKNFPSMKIEIRNLFLLTIVTAVLNLAAGTSSSSAGNFLDLDEFNSSPTRHNHRHHPSPVQRQQHQFQKDNDNNFILIDYLSDGERERRVSWNGLAGKETSIGDTSKSLSLWQLSDGRSFIQMIYTSDGQLMDCEYLRQKKLVADFLSRFYAEIEVARARNFTSPLSVPLNHHSLVSEHDFREYLDNGVATPEMEDLQYSVQEFQDGQSAAWQQDAFGLRNLTYVRLESDGDVPEDLREQLNYRRLKHQCDQRHAQMRDLAHGLESSDPQEQQTAGETLQRHKRAIADWFLSPNTKWCGRGHSAERYHHLGGASRADMCCRQHDYCKLNIPGMTTKWDLFNYRPYTISHCSCDQRFRTCLKMADSSDANMVGKLFFNIVQSKCFVLKPETVCTKTSWWGKCEKKVRRKRAHIRDNRKY
uniref:phospholipase A2 n=2 Tax=Culex pipiens TaxID=7175 RepID=A0A8D8IAV1_CULPI